MERFIDAGDHVAAIRRTRGHVLEGGAALDAAIAHVWTVRDDGVSRFEACIDTPAMPEAPGLH